MGVRREGRNSLRPPRMGNGRDALGPLRPCGFASLRQPDACGAGESCASIGPMPFSVERELDLPVAMAPSPSYRGEAPYGTRRRGAVATK